jgi:hypothetical protein
VAPKALDPTMTMRHVEQLINSGAEVHWGATTGASDEHEHLSSGGEQSDWLGPLIVISQPQP